MGARDTFFIDTSLQCCIARYALPLALSGPTKGNIVKARIVTFRKQKAGIATHRHTCTALVTYESTIPVFAIDKA
jgi:hypothetical protein